MKLTVDPKDILLIDDLENFVYRTAINKYSQRIQKYFGLFELKIIY